METITKNNIPKFFFKHWSLAWNQLPSPLLSNLPSPPPTPLARTILQRRHQKFQSSWSGTISYFSSFNCCDNYWLHFSFFIIKVINIWVRHFFELFLFFSYICTVQYIQSFLVFRQNFIHWRKYGNLTYHYVLQYLLVRSEFYILSILYIFF